MELPGPTRRALIGKAQARRSDERTMSLETKDEQSGAAAGAGGRPAALISAKRKADAPRPIDQPLHLLRTLTASEIIAAPFELSF